MKLRQWNNTLTVLLLIGSTGLMIGGDWTGALIVGGLGAMNSFRYIKEES